MYGMITYSSGTWGNLCKVCQWKGSLFPKSFSVAGPCAIFAALLRHFINNDERLEFLKSEDSILKETQAWAGFSVLVGFLVVFRTSQAYTRFWDGCTATHMMRAEWFDAASAIVAFCAHSKQTKEKIERFKHILVRLFSMLHAASMAELEDSTEDIQAFKFELIDADALDSVTLQTVMKSGDRVELLFSWIQLLIVENIDSGVLSIPPPILSRSFQEIANGMVAFHDAMQISYTPFPFPYAQTCDLLLILHWLIVPFVTTQWVQYPFWAFVFVFVQVFILWSLNFIAVEIENPFGSDANDLDGHHMQLEMNRQLTLLLQPSTMRSPTLRRDFRIDRNEHTVFLKQERCFNDIWASFDGRATPTSREKMKFSKREFPRDRSFREPQAERRRPSTASKFSSFSAVSRNHHSDPGPLTGDTSSGTLEEAMDCSPRSHHAEACAVEVGHKVVNFADMPRPAPSKAAEPAVGLDLEVGLDHLLLVEKDSKFVRNSSTTTGDMEAASNELEALENRKPYNSHQVDIDGAALLAVDDYSQSDGSQDHSGHGRPNHFGESNGRQDHYGLSNGQYDSPPDPPWWPPGQAAGHTSEQRAAPNAAYVGGADSLHVKYGR